MKSIFDAISLAKQHAKQFTGHGTYDPLKDPSGW